MIDFFFSFVAYIEQNIHSYRSKSNRSWSIWELFFTRFSHWNLLFLQTKFSIRIKIYAVLLWDSVTRLSWNLNITFRKLKCMFFRIVLVKILLSSMHPHKLTPLFQCQIKLRLFMAHFLTVLLTKADRVKKKIRKRSKRASP